MAEAERPRPRRSVAHVITMLELGGAQENTLATCAKLDRSRFDVSLIFGPGGMLDEEAYRIPALTTIPIPELVRPVAPVRDVECIKKLVKVFRELRPDIVHTHSSKAGILGRLAARAAGVPRVVHSIHGFGFHEGQAPLTHALFLNAERAIGSLTDAFIGVSLANLAEARALRIIGPKHRAELIRSGFDLAAFRREAALGPALRAELGLRPDDEVLISIANLKPQKDPLTLVRAMALVVERRPRAVLLYAGDGELRGRVEAEIGRLNLGARFRLLGWRRDVPALIAAGDVVVLSSIFEGLPRSAVQAVVARRPFVGTRVDGTAEVIRCGKNGYLVEPRAPAELANAIEKALVERPTDPEDDVRVEAWSVDEMVQRQEALYDRL